MSVYPYRIYRIYRTGSTVRRVKWAILAGALQWRLAANGPVFTGTINRPLLVIETIFLSVQVPEKAIFLAEFPLTASRAEQRNSSLP